VLQGSCQVNMLVVADRSSGKVCRHMVVGARWTSVLSRQSTTPRTVDISSVRARQEITAHFAVMNVRRPWHLSQGRRVLALILAVGRHRGRRSEKLQSR